MRIVQGKAPTSFGRLSAGENLRVRIAAALAVIEVARQRMYGRHPGLLVLDSPGAQEMAPADFAALLSRVHEAIQSVGDIQIIVGCPCGPDAPRRCPMRSRDPRSGRAIPFLSLAPWRRPI